MSIHGIMVYGYEKEKAEKIRDHFESVIDNSIILLNADNKEDETVESIITNKQQNVFKDGSPKILMFLGFSDREISKSVEMFQFLQGLSRPIFCGLTEENVRWPLNKLIHHLKKEEQYWFSSHEK